MFSEKLATKWLPKKPAKMLQELGNEVSKCHLKHSNVGNGRVRLASLNICQGVFHRAWKVAGTDHAKVTALKETAPRSPRSQLVWLHRRSHTDDHPLGVIVRSHIPPPPPVQQPVTVAAGHTWVSQCSAVLISARRRRGCWRGEVSPANFTWALNKVVGVMCTIMSRKQ